MEAKSTKLLRWMLMKDTFASHEVIQKGLEMYYIRADRSKRDFLEKGFIRKMSEWEKETKGWKCKDAVYQVNPRLIKEYLQPSLF